MPKVLIAAYNKPIQVELADKVRYAWQPPKYPPSIQQQAVIDWLIHKSGSAIVSAAAGAGKSSTLLQLVPHIARSMSDVNVATVHSVGLSAWRISNPKVKIDGNKMRAIIEQQAVAYPELGPLYQTEWSVVRKLVSFAKLDGFGCIGCPEIEDEAAWQALIDFHDLDGDIKGTADLDFDRKPAKILEGEARKKANSGGLEAIGLGAAVSNPSSDQLSPWSESKSGAAVFNVLDAQKLGAVATAVLPPPPELSYTQRLIQACQLVYLASLDSSSTLVDFDDMLLCPLYFNTRMPKYDYVLGDEIQDWSQTRRMIIVRSMMPETGRLIGVGDRRQACYLFAGASCDSMDRLKQDAKAEVEFPLTVTYRCSQSVVRLAQTIVPDIQARESAPLGSITGFKFGTDPVYLEPDAVKGQTDFWSFAPFTADDFILCRNNRPLVDLAYRFLRKRIPCIINGRDFADAVVSLIRKWRVKSLEQLGSRLETYRAREVAKYTKLGQDQKAADVEDKVETIFVLMAACRDIGGRYVDDLVSLIDSMFGEVKSSERPDCALFSSIHRGKGMERRRVFILGWDKFMPSRFATTPEQQEQEQNLIYIAYTRAEEQLIEVVVPETKKRYGG